MIIRGKAYTFGDDINTDLIIPARYLNTTDPQELARHCMEDARPELTGILQPGSVIVAGRNFGCGSSREHAPLAIKAAGIACVVAADFARIFFRNAINIGLPIVESPEALRRVKEGDEMTIDLERGEILLANGTLRIAPFPEFMQAIINKGGWLEYLAGGRQ